MAECWYVNPEGKPVGAYIREEMEGSPSTCPLVAPDLIDGAYGSFAETFGPENQEYQRWDFTNQVWYWMNTHLKDVCSAAAETALTADFTFNATTFAHANIPYPEIYALAEQARWEDPASVRKVAMKNGVSFNWTNQDLVSFVNVILNFKTKVHTAKHLVLADIDNDVVNTPTEVQTAFDGYMSAYTNTRNTLMTLPEIIEALEGLSPITPQAYIAPAATDAAANAPENLDPITTLLGTLTGRVNDANERYNDLAAKYNDLATKFNSLKAGLVTSGLMEVEA